MFKISRERLFNLFGYFCNMKHAFSGQVGDCFLVYLNTFVIRKMYVQNKRKAAFKFLTY